MKTLRRIPWVRPEHPSMPDLPSGRLVIAAGDPWGQAVAIAHSMGGSQLDIEVCGSAEDSGPATMLPALIDGDDVVCDDPVEIARYLAPDLFDDATVSRLSDVRTELLDRVYELGEMTVQGRYEDAHHELKSSVERWDDRLGQVRFLGGAEPDLSDVVLFTFAIRLDPVFYELFKASIGLLADFERLQNHARDLWERPAFRESTDFAAIKREHYGFEPVTNPRGFVPLGGIPDLDAPHFRAEEFEQVGAQAGVEEDADKSRGDGEWVRGASELRSWIRNETDARFPAEAGRYHLYAPYNCPWSHRALLARAVKGLEDVVGASVVYFRRHPERGWQFNPAIPGCTEDLAEGRDFVAEHYESIGSDERSVPILWDTVEKTIVNNESAEILRIFNSAFGDLAERDIDLYPAPHRAEIDRLNNAVYHRINNGAYKAGFANSQAAYEHAYRRYFRALEWVEELLGRRRWLAGTDRPTEADLRLFPTIFRHDEVYYSRFKLNERRVSSLPRLSDWLDRMMDVPGVSEASNLDHARNGYFGRTGNEIVPAGPVPLGLSRSDFTDAIWLAEGDE